MRPLPPLLLLAPLLLALSACGYRAPLTRLDPQAKGEEARAAREAEKQRVADMLTVAAETRPRRVDDLTVRLEERPVDPFALPPEGSGRARPVPFPGDPGAPPVEPPDQLAPPED